MLLTRHYAQSLYGSWRLVGQMWGRIQPSPTDLTPLAFMIVALRAIGEDLSHTLGHIDASVWIDATDLFRIGEVSVIVDTLSKS